MEEGEAISDKKVHLNHSLQKCALHLIFNEVYFIEIQSVSDEIFSVLRILHFYIKNDFVLRCFFDQMRFTVSIH